MTFANCVPNVAMLAEPARRLWLPFTLPSLNDLESARGNVGAGMTDGHGRFARWNGYNALKRRWQDTIALHALSARLAPIAARVVPVFRFYEQSRHRDPDGILSGASKLILDALGPGRRATVRAPGWRGAGVIHCDGQHCIACPPIGQLADVAHPSGAVEVLLFEVSP